MPLVVTITRRGQTDDRSEIPAGRQGGPVVAQPESGTAISPSRDQSSCGIEKLTILGV